MKKRYIAEGKALGSSIWAYIKELSEYVTTEEGYEDILSQWNKMSERFGKNISCFNITINANGYEDLYIYFGNDIQLDPIA